MRLPLCVAGLAASLAMAGCDSGGSSDGGCQAESDQTLCARLGKNCDSLMAFDNCGESRTVGCGTCYGTCQANVCDVDAGPPDAGPPDAGPPDAGPLDAGPLDAGCPAAGCPTQGTWFQGDFTLRDANLNQTGVFDQLRGESLSLIVSFKPGTPAAVPNGIGVPTGPVHVGFAGDTSGFIASTYEPALQDQPGFFIVSPSGLVDFGVVPTDQTYTLEFSCMATNLANNGISLTLVSDTCTNAFVTFRRFDSSLSITDNYSSPATSISFHYDGGP